MLFQVSVTELKKVFDLPGSWTDQDYRDLLTQLEVDELDDLSGSDLLDILLMALQDMEPDDAADLVLAKKLPRRISSVSRQNIVQDLLEGQRPWEESADIQIHAGIFAAAVLLNRAIPKKFEKPDILQLTLHLQALKPEARRIFEQPPQAAFVTRLLADGMDENCILERLFDEQLYSHSFPEADGIIWKAEFAGAPNVDESSFTLVIYSSAHWLEAMKSVDEFKSRAYKDRAVSKNDKEDEIG